MKERCKEMRIHMTRLIRIQLLQSRKFFWGIVAVSLAAPLWNTWMTYAKLSGAEPGEIFNLDGYQMPLTIMFGLILAANYNILSKNEIRTFPGTVLSRFGSSVIMFHIMILVSAVASVCSYVLQGGLLMLLDLFSSVGISGNFFDASYLLRGAVRYMAVMMAFYGVSLLWFVLLERFRPIWVYLVTGVLLVGNAAMALSNGTNYWPMHVVGDLLRGDGFSYGVQIALLFETWAVCLFLSTFLTYGVKAWGNADGKRLAVTIALGYFILMACLWTPAFYGWSDTESLSYTMDLQNFQRDSLHQAEIVVDVSDWEESDPRLLNMYNLALQRSDESGGKKLFYSSLFAGVSCSADEAKAYGLSFDESKLDRNHVIMLLGTNRLTFGGKKDLGENLLRSIQTTARLEPVNLVKTQVDGEEVDEEMDSDSYRYQVEVDRTECIVINEFYGDSGLYRDHSLREKWGFQRVTDSLLGVVIY